MQSIDLSNLNGNFQPVFLDNDFLQNFLNLNEKDFDQDSFELENLKGGRKRGRKGRKGKKGKKGKLLNLNEEDFDKGLQQLADASVNANIATFCK